MYFPRAVGCQFDRTIIMCRTAGNVAIGKRAALCHVCHIFKRNVVAFHGNISCVQLAKIHYIAFNITSCQRIIAAFKRTKLIGAQLTRGNIQTAYIHPCVISKQNAVRVDNINTAPLSSAVFGLL